MTDKEILEGNKLIAEFMKDDSEYRITKDKGIKLYDNPHCAEAVEEVFLSYHSSFNSLTSPSASFSRVVFSCSLIPSFFSFSFCF